MDAVAIQDANKIRVAMGLAPLPVPGETGGLQFKSKDNGQESDPDDMSTLDKRQAAAGDNWKKLQDEEKTRQERLARKEALKKARDIELRNAKLQGSGLGDAAEVDMDTKTWLMQQKKRQKKIEKARRYEEEQAEIERQAQAEYSSKDLAGVKVAHELDHFDAEGEQILTLKDAAIGNGDESEEDELENLDLRAKELLQEKLERKKNKPVYNPNDMEDGERSILAHYDEEIDGGKKRKVFTLDTSGAIDQAAVAAQREAAEAERIGLKGIKFSLDILQDDTPTSDYLEPSTKIRKPKKPKKAKTTRTKAVDEDDILHLPVPQPSENQMDIDGQPPTDGTAKKRVLEFDDDDLQARLAETRRQALKKRKKTDATELARRIREEDSATPMNTGQDDEEPGLVIDETTEFVSNLRRPQSPSPADERKRKSSTHAEGEAQEDDEDTAMAESYAAVEDEEDALARREASENAINAITSTGFEDEEDASTGTGGILNMLRRRGIVQESDADRANAAVRAQQQFLAENQALVDEYDRKTKEAREKDRASGRFDRLSHREREEYSRRQNEQRDAYLASLQAEHFKRSYKPNVQLRYNDEDGREMNQKEAFKHLSHRFHGKGSGKQKTEKRMKKKQEEDDRQRKSLLGFTGTNEAVGATAKKNRQAGVRLQ
jgi:U4/U6.U5 tri-snRNP-associated protein 1